MVSKLELKIKHIPKNLKHSEMIKKPNQLHCKTIKTNFKLFRKNKTPGISNSQRLWFKTFTSWSRFWWWIAWWTKIFETLKILLFLGMFEIHHCLGNRSAYFMTKSSKLWWQFRNAMPFLWQFYFLNRAVSGFELPVNCLRNFGNPSFVRLIRRAPTLYYQRTYKNNYKNYRLPYLMKSINLAQRIAT